MPELCRFNGIIIRIRFREHPPPHFHVEYGDFNAKVDIDPPSVTAGRLPPRIERVVIEWTTLRQQELRDAWQNATRQEPVTKIPPLE